MFRSYPSWELIIVRCINRVCDVDNVCTCPAASQQFFRTSILLAWWSNERSVKHNFMRKVGHHLLACCMRTSIFPLWSVWEIILHGGISWNSWGSIFMQTYNLSNKSQMLATLRLPEGRMGPRIVDLQTDLVTTASWHKFFQEFCTLYSFLAKALSQLYSWVLQFWRRNCNLHCI